MMFEIYKFSEPEIIAFILVLIRISACVVTMPILGGENIPPQIKILTSLVLSMLVFPIVGWKQLMGTQYSDFILWLAFKEVLIGIILGFSCRLFFFALTLAGEIISLSIGLSSEQLLNPVAGGRSSAIQQFYLFIGTLFFLSIDGHYYLVTALITSFSTLPLSLGGFEMLSAQQIGMLGTEIILAGVKMGAPIMATIFFTNLVMGVIGRAVPQINVLITSLPVNIMVGFFVLLVSIPLMLMSMDDLIGASVEKLFFIMKEL